MPWTNYLILLLTASTKFALTPIVSLPMEVQPHILFLIMLTGGFLSYFSCFYFSGYLINRFANKLQLRKKERKIFNKKNRLIIKLVRTKGMYLLALITPIILSVPVGAFIAARYYTNKSKINTIMVGAIIMWATIYTVFRDLVASLSA